MIGSWPWWLGGIALALVMVLHWLLMRRMMAVSGRVTALVNRVWFGKPEAESDELSPEELARALADATAAEFGEPAPVEVAPVALKQPQPPSAHVLFFVGLFVGGLVSALVAHAYNPKFGLAGERFELTFGGGGLGWAALAVGGVLVGFGTRMAGGCTTGHGLCGVSRFQPGSLIATASFFGAAVLVSLVLWGLS